MSIVSVFGCSSVTIILLLSWPKNRVYIYKESTLFWINELLKIGNVCLFAVIVINIVMLGIHVKQHQYKKSLIILFFSLSLMATAYLGHRLTNEDNSLYTLISPIIISKDGNNEITVCRKNEPNSMVKLIVTEAEYSLLQEGFEYASIVYIGNLESGILQRVWTFSE